MKKLTILSSFIFIIFLNAKYLDNHSCSECHEKIYEEYETSAHSRGYFNNELHRKIANKADSNRYECATCHMPMADNLKDLINGKARPNKNNKTHTDAVSCYFCHTIAYVKKAHNHNINIKARQAKNFKPTIYGLLDNPEDSDKHSSNKNPLYKKIVCIGCHSHKLNDNNITIFRAMSNNQNSVRCIECHMPKVSGGVEKMDKRARGEHASHRFLGIHDKEFRKKGIDINATIKDKILEITLTNKMPHPLIIQPARAKFLKIVIERDNKVIWKNYKKSPSEDKKAYFAYSFKKDGRKIIIPATATEGSVHNLNAKESKILIYTIPILKKGDKIVISLYVQFAKSDCTKVINLSNKKLLKPELIKKLIVIKR